MLIYFTKLFINLLCTLILTKLSVHTMLILMLCTEHGIRARATTFSIVEPSYSSTLKSRGTDDHMKT